MPPPQTQLFLAKSTHNTPLKITPQWAVCVVTYSGQHLIFVSQGDIKFQKPPTQLFQPIPPKKTKLFITNFTINHQFDSQLTIPGQPDPIETTSETKLLGYWLTSDMKTETHVNFIVSKCYKRIWAVRKLKRAEVPPDDILNFYFMKVRSVLESSCPVFHSMLTIDDQDDHSQNHPWTKI